MEINRYVPKYKHIEIVYIELLALDCISEIMGWCGGMSMPQDYDGPALFKIVGVSPYPKNWLVYKDDWIMKDSDGVVSVSGYPGYPHINMYYKLEPIGDYNEL